MNLDGSKTTLVGDISIKKGCFPEERKLAEVNPPPPKKKMTYIKNITGLSVLYWTCQKSKESSIIKYMIT